MPSQQKLGIILENKMSKNNWSGKKCFYKKWSPKLIFLNEKKSEKIPLVFDVEN